MGSAADQRTAVRTRRRITAAVVGANLVGGVVVWALLTYVLPLPRGNSGVNNAATAIYLPLALLAGWWWGLRRTDALSHWLVTGRPPTERERMLVLHAPTRLLTVHAGLWGAAILVFAAINLPHSAALGGWIAATVLLGGVMTSTIAYLASEQLLRPITAQVLAHEPLSRPALPGVRARLVVAWSMGTGVPLLGIVLVGDRKVALLAAAGLAVGLIALLLVASSIGRPLSGLREAFDRVRGGDIETTVQVDDSSEVGLLQAGFNQMVAGLRERERLHDLFGRHVGEDVARQALRDGVRLGGELRDAAVLFVDIVGSTRLPEDHAPDEVVALLNRFFAVVVETVAAHGGWVNKFEGDAALCIFGAPADLPDKAGCALAAGRELAERLELPAGIGISAGPVVAGNVGAAERYEYTVIGAPVNEAARLTELAKGRDGVRLVAGADVIARASRAEAARWRLGESVVLRGMTAPTRLAVPV